MSDQAKLRALIARLEAATGGSRELDAAIAVAVFGGGSHDPGTAQNYTTSLDAALSLWDMPDIGHNYPRRGVNLFYSVLPGGKMAWAAQAWELKDGNSVILRMAMASHRSQPMAACIAALKAKAGMSDPAEIVARALKAEHEATVVSWYEAAGGKATLQAWEKDGHIWLRQAKAALAALREAGFKVLPREPDERMTGAAKRQMDHPRFNHYDVWRAMWDAAESDDPAARHLKTKTPPATNRGR